MLTLRTPYTNSSIDLCVSRAFYVHVFNFLKFEFSSVKTLLHCIIYASLFFTTSNRGIMSAIFSLIIVRGCEIFMHLFLILQFMIPDGGIMLAIFSLINWSLLLSEVFYFLQFMTPDFSFQNSKWRQYSSWLSKI